VRAWAPAAPSSREWRSRMNTHHARHGHRYLTLDAAQTDPRVCVHQTPPYATSLDPLPCPVTLRVCLWFLWFLWFLCVVRYANPDPLGVRPELVAAAGRAAKAAGGEAFALVVAGGGGSSAWSGGPGGGLSLGGDESQSLEDSLASYDDQEGGGRRAGGKGVCAPVYAASGRVPGRGGFLCSADVGDSGESQPPATPSTGTQG
jgi:hypothetical protein